MRFNEFWSSAIAGSFLTAIQQIELSDDSLLLSTYNTEEFYLITLSLGSDRELCDLALTARDSDNVSILISIFIKKYSDRWKKVYDSLKMSINAFDTSNEVINSTDNSSIQNENNFDYFQNENNENPKNDRLNTENTTGVKNTVISRSSRQNINYESALKRFLKATNLAIIDVVSEDLIDFLTVDIY